MTNVSPIDKWTPVHVVTGALAQSFGMRPMPFLVLSIGYELIEFRLEQKPNIFGSTRPESTVNAVTDIIFGLLGYALATAIMPRRR